MTGAVIIKVAHSKGNELPDMTREQRVTLRRNLIKAAAEKTNLQERGEIIFVGTLVDLRLIQPNYPYCLWRVSGLSDSRAIEAVQEVIEEVISVKPDESYMTITSKCVI